MELGILHTRWCVLRMIEKVVYIFIYLALFSPLRGQNVKNLLVSQTSWEMQIFWFQSTQGAKVAELMRQILAVLQQFSLE